MRRIIPFLLLVLLFTAPAYARIIPYLPSLHDSTLEALTAESPLIIIATLDAHFAVTWTVEVHPIEILKSPAGFTPPTPFTTSLPFWDFYAGAPWPAPGARVLLFLSNTRSTGPTDWQICDFIILDPPSAPATPGFVVPPSSAHSTVVLDLSLNPVPDTPSILRIVREELGRNPGTTSVERFDVHPFELSTLPSDSRILPKARIWAHSGDPSARLLAARIMEAHPDPQDIPLLQALKDDPYTYEDTSHISPWSTHEYLIRRSAANSLSALGQTIGPATLSTLRTDLYQPVSLFAAVIYVAGPLLLYIPGLAIFCRVRRRTTPTLRRWICSCISVLCLWYALISGFLCYRSTQIVDNSVWANHGALVDITSANCVLYVELANHWPAETPFVHCSFTPSVLIFYLPATDLHEPITGFRSDAVGSFLSYSFPRASQFRADATWRLPSISRQKTEFNLPHFVGTYSNTLVSCSYPCLIILLLIFPALHFLLTLIAKFRQYRRRRRSGLCPSCSYDLRAHLPGDRCPECGTPVPQAGASITHS